jgi:hypothetical protein
MTENSKTAEMPVSQGVLAPSDLLGGENSVSLISPANQKTPNGIKRIKEIKASLSKPKYKIHVGDRYGKLTVISDLYQRNGLRMFECLCDCGATVFWDSAALRNNKYKMCYECCPSKNRPSDKVKIIGQVFGSIEVLRENGRNHRGELLYECRCVNCGNITKKTSVKARKQTAEFCSVCLPRISYENCGDISIGTLPDGFQFTIDTEDLPIVSKLSWYHHKGYVYSGGGGGEHIALHRLVFGAKDDVYIDHINRCRSDCRKANLRITTIMQNAWNAVLRPANSSGYRGVFWDETRMKYASEIQRFGVKFRLGRFEDAILAAQAYNIANEFLSGDFVGYQNEVPMPTEDFRQRITQRCLSYLSTNQGGNDHVTRRIQAECGAQKASAC